MHTIPEQDWRVFRELHAVALERYCEKLVDDLQHVLSKDGTAALDRYHAVHDILRKRDPELARAFDDVRRSTAELQILVIHRLGLLRPEEIARFSDETRSYVERAAAAGGLRS